MGGGRTNRPGSPCPRPYLQDWLTDSTAGFSWRLDKERAGSGALGDIGAHIIDLTQHVVGERITSVNALLRTFVAERPDEHGDMAKVTVDDASLFLAEFGPQAVATFEASRMASGRRNSLRFELYGTEGSLAFDLERLNELTYYDARLPSSEQGACTILVTEPDHPWLEAWWPPGHVLGWEHTFVHQARDLVHALASQDDPAPSLHDGLQVQTVLEAVEQSATSGRWTKVRATDAIPG